MSWSVSLSPVAVEDFDNAIDEAVGNWQNMNQSAEDAAREQVTAAVAVAKTIVASGVVVPAGTRVGCTLSGHANPDHLPREGYGNDSIAVSVYQAT